MSNMVSFDEILDPSNYGGALIRRAPLLGSIRYLVMFFYPILHVLVRAISTKLLYFYMGPLLHRLK